MEIQGHYGIAPSQPGARSLSKLLFQIIFGCKSVSRLVHIVDDDAHVRAAFSYLLASRDFAIRAYASGAELLAAAELEPGCVLLDLRMPDMSGRRRWRGAARRCR